MNNFLNITRGLKLSILDIDKYFLIKNNKKIIFLKKNSVYLRFWFFLRGGRKAVIYNDYKKILVKFEEGMCSLLEELSRERNVRGVRCRKEYIPIFILIAHLNRLTLKTFITF
jgi:hypothetical protein